MNYTKEEVEKSIQIHREFEAEFWGRCAEHVKEATKELIGLTHCSEITVNGSWYFTVFGFERGFIGRAVVQIDNSVSLGFIRSIRFVTDHHDGLQKEITYSEK